MDREPHTTEKLFRFLCLVGAIFSLLFVLVPAHGTWAEEPAPSAAPTEKPAAPGAKVTPSAEPSQNGEKPTAPAEKPAEEKPVDKPSAAASGKPTSAAKTYVGRKACEECHEDYKDTFPRTLHAMYPGTSPTSANQCEACHGPGSQHVDDNEPSSIISPRRLKPNQINTLCQKCHEASQGQYEWRFSRHATSSVACTECHAVHPKKKADLQPRLLRKGDEKELCYSCHAEIKGQTFMPSHHPIEEGRLKCSDCHNVHGSEISRFKNAPNSRELCLQCHQNFRGPFTVEHQPVSDDCNICHKPHGSMETNLLTMSEPFLCQRCHATVHNPHVPPVLTPPAQIGNQALMFSRCTVCHYNVHGSQQSPTFTR